MLLDCFDHPRGVHLREPQGGNSSLHAEINMALWWCCMSDHARKSFCYVPQKLECSSLYGWYISNASFLHSQQATAVGICWNHAALARKKRKGGTQGGFGSKNSRVFTADEGKAIKEGCCQIGQKYSALLPQSLKSCRTR